MRGQSMSQQIDNHQRATPSSYFVDMTAASAEDPFAVAKRLGHINTGQSEFGLFVIINCKKSIGHDVGLF